MSKSKKIFWGIVGGILGSCGITVLVFYCINKTQTTKVIMDCWKWLNQPLPLIGISAIAVLGILIKLFSMTSFGKKAINQMRKENAELRQEIQEFKVQEIEWQHTIEKFVAEKSSELNKTNETMKKICDTIPNKKVKKIGESIYVEAEKAINSETTAE